MDCPVCLCSIKKSSATCVTLECGHSLCFGCAHKWIITKNPTCPLCRSNTSYFSRDTRSKNMANIICIAFSLATELYSIHDGILDIQDLIYTIKNLYEPYKEIWKRPDMVAFRFFIRDNVKLCDIKRSYISRKDIEMFTDFVSVLKN